MNCVRKTTKDGAMRCMGSNMRRHVCELVLFLVTINTTSPLLRLLSSLRDFLLCSSISYCLWKTDASDI